MIITKDSHLDHGIPADVLSWLLHHFADRDAFFVETVEIPTAFGELNCDLIGPAIGDEPVPEAKVQYRVRGDRTWASRVVRYQDPGLVRTVTVVAGPHDGHDCVLYTVYPGPAAPQEPGDPDCKDVEASKAFWAEHALGVAS